MANLLGMFTGPPPKYYWYEEVLPALKGRMKDIED